MNIPTEGIPSGVRDLPFLTQASPAHGVSGPGDYTPRRSSYPGLKTKYENFVSSGLFCLTEGWCEDVLTLRGPILLSFRPGISGI